MEGLIEKLRKPLRQGALAASPHQMQFHLTDFCNLRCIFCPTKTLLPGKSPDRGGEMATRQWLTLVEEAVKLGVEEFHICGGGEPFLCGKKALAVMRRIKRLGASGEVITNGTMFSHSSIEEIVALGWDKITFSIDGPVAGVHDAIRGKPSFGRILRAMGEFARLKRELGAEKPQLCIHLVVCSLNYGSIAQMVPLSKSVGADTFLIQALNVWSDDIRQYKLTAGQEEELLALLKGALAEADRMGLATNIREFLGHDLFSKANAMDKAMEGATTDEPFIGVPCFMPWYNLSVFADGRTLPCFILRDEGISFKEHTLAEIWESGYFNSLRERMRAGKLGQDCAKCNPWSMPKMEEIRSALRREVAQHAR